MPNNDEGHSIEELIKGYWDYDKEAHVKGLWERVGAIERSLKYLPHAFFIMVALEAAVLAKNLDVGTVVQIIASLFLK